MRSTVTEEVRIRKEEGVNMLTIKELEQIMMKARESMEIGGILDINIAANELRVKAEKLAILLKHPSMRPIQESYDLIMAMG